MGGTLSSQKQFCYTTQQQRHRTKSCQQQTSNSQTIYKLNSKYYDGYSYSSTNGRNLPLDATSLTTLHICHQLTLELSAEPQRKFYYCRGFPFSQIESPCIIITTANHEQHIITSERQRLQHSTTSCVLRLRRNTHCQQHASFDSLLSHAGLGKGRLFVAPPPPANGLFYPSWNRFCRFPAYQQQCGRLPNTDLTTFSIALPY